MARFGWSVTNLSVREPVGLVYVLVFLSGLSSLIYEIAWIRQASFAFGSSALALSTVLAVFFMGLGSGSWLLGRIGARVRQPLLWCAGIEVLLALNGLAGESLFERAEALYGVVYRRYEPASIALLSLRFTLVASLLFPPSLLMGGTLPLFCRQLMHDPQRLSAKLGHIYGCNTLGATLGCFATGFWLLPKFGLSASLSMAAGLNLLAGTGFWGLARALGPLAPRRDYVAYPCVVRAEAPDASDTAPLWLAALLFFMIGAVALANELLWARFLTHFMRSSIYTYTIALGVVLAGTAIGSASCGHWFDRFRGAKPLLLGFSGLQALSGALILILTHLPAHFWRSMQAFGVVPFILLMLPPALIAGASFPLVNRMVTHDPRQAPQEIGRMTAWNILGCIFGSLVTGFVLLPHFGLDVSIYVAVACSLCAAFMAFWMGLDGRLPSRRNDVALAVGVHCAIALWLVLLVFPPVRIPHDLMGGDEVLLDLVEGYNSNLAVTLRGQEKTLLIDRLWQGVDRKNYQIMVAHVPMLHHPDAKDVLVIGLGAGTTASRFLRYGIEHLHIVDIEPKIFDFTRKHFPSGWVDDPRVKLIPEDGRNYMKHTGHPYDFVSVEVGQLDRPGVGVFYTQEFYREVRARLNQDGMIAQFVPLRFLRPADFAGILRTFLGVFPNARLWYNTDELLLMGFKDRAPRLSPQRYARSIQDHELLEDLAIFYWGGSTYNLNRFPAFVSGFLAGGTELQSLANIAPSEVFTDDRLQLSYSVSDYSSQDRRVMELVPFIMQHLSRIEEAVEPGTTDSETLKTASSIRRHNVADIAAQDILGSLETSPPPTPETVYAGTTQALHWNPLNLEAQFRQRSAAMAMGQDRGTAEAETPR